MSNVNRKYKDRVFKFIFGNPENKAWTLSLYNAVNGSQYRNPEDIQFNTIEDAVYLGMKNDVSFIIRSEMNLWQHQKTLQNFEAAVEATIQEMPEDFEIHGFLVANRAEVRRMLLTEYDEEKVLAQERKEAENKVNERVATDMIRDGEPLAKIKKYSQLPEAAIRKLAKSMGVAVL